MNPERPLRGACSCGRNRYVIVVPPETSETLQVYFDSSHSHRRAQASPLSAWLRVPLAWYQSTTHSFHDDETHSTIRRCYTSPNEVDTKRHFCGYCGTPLSFWSEKTPSEADYINCTLGSLQSSDLHDLEEMNLLPKAALDDAEDEKDAIEEFAHDGALDVTSLPWFDSMMKGSKLGKVTKSTGSERRNDGLQIEWEIVEWTEDGGEVVEIRNGKRKIAESEGPDSVMDGLH